jgi:hypothetical protein
MSTTTVSGTVTDSDGIAWAGGAVIFQLVNPNPQIAPSVGGVPMTAGQQSFIVVLDGTGSFSTSVTDTSTIVPALTKWRITVDSATSAPGQNLTPIQITGPTLSLTATIASQIQPIRLAAGANTRAYSDVEIIATPPPGATYFNVTSVATRIWTGTSWQNAGSGTTGNGNQVRLSSIPGIVLDCVVGTGAKIGGGVPTNNTATLNAWLADATHSGVNHPTELIIDGGCAANVILPAAGHIKLTGLGYGTGFFTPSASNADPLNNGTYPFQPSGAAPAQSGPVYLSGFLINGNRGNGTNGNSSGGDPRGTGTYWFCGITLYGVNGVYIDKMYVYDASAYSVRLTNCSQVHITDNIMVNPNTTAGLNNDNIHINSPATDVFITNNYLSNNNSDDAIAINSPEGYTPASIDRVVIEHNTIATVLHALRVYGDTSHGVGTVTFHGNVVYTTTNVIFLGVPGASGTDDIACRSLNVSGNLVFNVTGTFFSFNSNVGTINFSDTEIDAAVATHMYSFGASCSVSNFNISNVIVYRSTLSGSVTVSIGFSAVSSSFNRMTIDNFQIADESGTAYASMSAILFLANTTINSLHVSDMDWLHITGLCDSYANVGNLTGIYQPESNVVAVSGAYTTLTTDRTILADTTAGSFAVALPAKAYKGGKYTFKNVAAANTLTITGTIDGSANPTLGTKAFMTVLFDGTNYQKVG